MAENSDNSVRVDNLAQTARSVAPKGPAPVHLWNPPFCGEMDLEIRRDGTWWHEGAPIARPGLVRLFANILKREGDRFYLVSPVEKLGIRVQDAPFLITDAQIDPDRITLTTSIGDQVVVDADHPIIMRGGADDPRPYVHLRGGLEGLIDRKTFYRLAEAALPGPDGRAGIRSCGAFFGLEA